MRCLTRARPNLPTIAVVALLSLAGIATANRAIRDNTINSRDIKDNQVNTRDVRNNSLTTRDVRDNQINTRDLRNGAIRGVDVHDGSLSTADLSPAAAAYAGSAVLFDPRAHDQDSDGNGVPDDPKGTVPGHVCCLTWKQGPVEVDDVVPVSADPLPGAASGRNWRSVTLDPGAYVVQTTGYAREAGAATDGVASRLFLGGHALPDGATYPMYPVSPGGLPVSHSHSTAIEVGEGTPAERKLVQRVTAIEGKAEFSDNMLIWEVTPR
jgi:hypothetical protein